MGKGLKIVIWVLVVVVVAWLTLFISAKISGLGSISNLFDFVMNNLSGQVLPYL